MNRHPFRSTFGLAAALALVGALVGGLSLPVAVAQTATPGAFPAAAFTAAALGLPEIRVTITPDGLVAPAEVAAGRYLVTVASDRDNPSPLENVNTDFIRIPEGETLADLNAKVQAVRDANTATTPPAEDPSAFLNDATLAGGTGTVQGTVTQSIVDLGPGLWALFDAGWELDAVALDVTGAMPATLPEPPANATVTETNGPGGFALQVEGVVSAGPQIVKVVNATDGAVHITVPRAPEGYTLHEETLGQIFQRGPEATPDAALGLPTLGQLDFSYNIGFQSAGVTQWFLADFAPASYALIALLPDAVAVAVINVV